jgi:lysophospholipase L1-like esterase
VGDSVTFGFRVPRVLPRAPHDFNPAAKSYPALLEEALRAANPGREIEVVPLAVPGYSSHQGRLWLTRDIDRYQPDLVIGCFGWNDISARGRTDRETMKNDAFSVALRRVFSSSQLVVRLGLWIRGWGAKPAAESATLRVPREEYVENMLEIARLSRARGATPVLLGPVYRDRTSHPPEGDLIHAHRAALREAAGQARVAYLEFPELTEDAPENALLFEEHIHPSPKGHRLMADALLRFLGERRLLGDLRTPEPTDRSSAATPAP